MGQHNHTVNKITEYIDRANAINAIEAADGKMTYYYNHGGTRTEILRGTVEINNVVYRKGDVINSPPTDNLYIKYNNNNPLYVSFSQLLKGSC